MSDEFKWDPSNDIFNISLMGVEYNPQYSLNTRLINMVKDNSPCSPPTVESEDDTQIDNFDRAMINLSLRLAESLIR